MAKQKKKQERDPRDPWEIEDDPREFVYINSYFELNVKRGTRITVGDRETKEIKHGAVAWDDRNAMLYVLFDEEENAEGPYRPESDLISYE